MAKRFPPGILGAPAAAFRYCHMSEAGRQGLYVDSTQGPARVPARGTKALRSYLNWKKSSGQLRILLAAASCCLEPPRCAGTPSCSAVLHGQSLEPTIATPLPNSTQPVLTRLRMSKASTKTSATVLAQGPGLARRTRIRCSRPRDGWLRSVSVSCATTTRSSNIIEVSSPLLQRRFDKIASYEKCPVLTLPQASLIDP